MRRLLLVLSLTIMACQSGGTHVAPTALTAIETQFVGCWSVNAPLIDNGPWQLRLNSDIVGSVRRGATSSPLREAAPDARVARLYHAGGWGRLYPVDSITYYVTLGAVPPAALELSLAAHRDSLVGTASRITATAPYRTPIGPATLVRCAT
jgi:hypothetical protein